MALADILAGYGDAAEQQHNQLLQMQYGMRKQAADYFGKLADDPRYDPASQQAFMQKGMEILSGDPMKPLGSKDLDMSKIMVQSPYSPTPPGAGTPQNLQMPQTGPLPTTATTQVAPPGPPPTHPANQMMDLEQQIELQRQRALASIGGIKETLWKPESGTSLVRDMPDGSRHKFAIEMRLNPATGQQERREVDLGDVNNFAPRLGNPTNVSDLVQFQQLDPKARFLDEDNRPLDMIAAYQQNPQAMFVPIGGDRYRPYTQKQDIKGIAGYNVPVGAYSGTVTGPPLGQQTQTLPTERQQTVRMPGGHEGTVTLETGKKLPPPPAPPGQVPAPQAPQGAPAPSTAGGEFKPGPITEDAIQQVMSLNQGLDRATVIQALHNSGWWDPGQAPPKPTPAAAPVPPPAVQPQTKNTPTVTPLQGAGQGLTADQVKTEATRAGVLGTTLGRGANVLNTFDQLMGGNKLQDFLKRAQLQIVSDPASATKFRLLVSNLSNLTPQEAHFAADYASLGEDINVMRAITNATGFRGKEAFEVLQGQRGGLLGNPDVFKDVLQNSLRTIITQLGPLNRQLLDSGYQTPLNQDIFNGYKSVYGPNRKDVEDALRKDLWVK